MDKFIPLESLAGRLGGQTGTGIAQALENVASYKANLLHQQQQKQAFQSLGFSPEEASQLKYFSPEIQKEIVKQKMLAPSQEAYARALGLSPEEQQPQAQPQEFNVEQLLGQPYQARAGLDLLKPQAQPQFMQQPAEPLAEQLEAKPLTATQQIEKRKAAGQAIPARLTEKQATEIAKFQQKERLLGKQIEAKEQSSIDKETKPVYDEVIKGDKSAKEDDLRLDRMGELISKGKLSSPAAASAVKAISKGILGFGIDTNFLLSADSQEFDKLSTDFLKSAKEIFGSRLTNFDVDSFLKTVPTLLQSDAGKKRVIANLKAFNEAKHLRAKAMKEIIKENGGKRPRHLDTLIDEKIQPQLDELATRFKAGYGGNPEDQGSTPGNILKFLHNQAVSLGGGFQKPIL